MSEKRFRVRFEQEDGRGEIVNEKGVELTAREVVDCLNEQQELIGELQVSDEMGWKRAEKFEKKIEKELKQKRIYIKRLEYKVQKFKEMNGEQQSAITKLNELNDNKGKMIISLIRTNKTLKEKNEELKEINEDKEQDVLHLYKKNEQLKQELRGMEELLKSYRETIKHDAELLADASKKGYLPPLNDYVSTEGWICGCCKHFHSGVRDRCDKDNNWVLKDGSCQDFER